MFQIPGMMQGRPPLERFRVTCTVCLVFDALFVLIFALTALESSSATWKTACYQAHGYIWNNVVNVTVIISCVVAAWGVLLHGSIVTSGEGAPLQVRHLISASRYGHALVGWTFITAVLQAIAYQQQPGDCTSPPSSSSDDTPSVESNVNADTIWQMGYTILWLTWVISSVAAAMAARRNMPLLKEVRSQEVLREDSFANEEASPEGANMPTLVGMPVGQALPDGVIIVSGQATVPTPQIGVAVGAISANGVAQGMPVPGSSTRAPGPKTVD